MNLVATGPVVPPLASAPWHGTQYVAYRSRPMAIDASDIFTGFGFLAATSRCSFGMTISPPRGTTPAGIGNERSPGMIRGVCVMLSFQRMTIAVNQSPAAAPTISRVRMKTYFTRGSPSSRFHFLGAGGAQELVHRGRALRSAVHGHAEAVVGEPGVEGRARLQARQPSQHDHADDGGEAAEEHHHLERDDEEWRQGRADHAAGHQLQELDAGQLPTHQRGTDRDHERRGDPGKAAEQGEDAHPADRAVALQHLLDLVDRNGRVDREVVIAARPQLLERPHRRVDVREDPEDRLSGHGSSPAWAPGSSPSPRRSRAMASAC